MEAKKEILIIDDEVDFRLILAEIFVEQGYKVITAKNGEEALELIRRSDKFPDLITVDVNMPVQDGMKFREEILKINPHAPLIMISGFLPKTANINGVRACLSKPLDKIELINVIENHKFYSAYR
jgi:CheY-like chemotaxis protein